MKNKFCIIILIFFFDNLFAETLSINAKNITFDKNTNISIFENEVVVRTKNKVLKSDFAKYEREKGFLILRKNILIVDEKNNKMTADYAEYFEKKQVLKTVGSTLVSTDEGYILEGNDLFVDNKEQLIRSDEKSILKDQDGNLIFLDNFEYSVKDSLFKSIGLIEIQDYKKNKYEFSQVYIDTKKKEILGTDSKTYFNDNEFKINPKNNPRIFSNTINLKKEKKTFNKSVFTLCQFREKDKCPPWSIQSTNMMHDNVKKTIYYKNAVIKVYDLPLFYFPRLSHPDPTVDRRSGFLVPTLYDSKNLGSGISIPYFFDFGKDKNFTLTNRIYAVENPLILGEYHQAFRQSNLLTDFGFTEGYKKTSSTKKGGEKSHFFTKYIKNFKSNDDDKNSLEINFQNVSDDKYLKLYKVESNLVDFNIENLENSINFSKEKDNLFFGINASVYETLKKDYEDKYEYILPEITLDKNLFSKENFGTLDLQTNYKVHNYETNKLTNFLVNDINFESNENIINELFNTKFLANFKNVNYESKNVDLYKNNPTSELFGSIGILSQLNLEKIVEDSLHYLKPKIFIRAAP